MRKILPLFLRIYGRLTVSFCAQRERSPAYILWLAVATMVWVVKDRFLVSGYKNTNVQV